MIAIDGVSAEGRVVFANLERGLILSAIVPSHERVHAVPLLDYRQLGRRRTGNRRYALGATGYTDSNLTAASRFNGSLSLGTNSFR